MSAKEIQEHLANNPLLDHRGLPRFGEIRSEHVATGLKALLHDLDERLDACEAAIDPTWSRVIEPLEEIADRLGRAWGVVGHLMGVQNSDDLRAAHDEVQGDVVTFGLRQGQSRPIYDALVAMRNGDEWSGLDEAQQRIVESMLRDALHSGVSLDGAEKERFNEIQHELAQLYTDFSNHVLDATNAFSLTLRDEAEMEGTPDSLRELAAQAARDAGETDATPERGPWRITLDYPSVYPYLENGRCRARREELYRAHITRASSGEHDNAPLIERILGLRLEEARLLGYEDFAALSLATKMAGDAGRVSSLLERLREASIESAEHDLAELAELASERGAEEGAGLRHWDIAFWAERLREARFDYSEEDLRPYFPLPKVLEGLFALARELFGVDIRAADGEADVWHADVRFFRVFDEAGEAIAAFFLDPYSRPAEKRGGAWMDECVSRSRREGLRLPVAYLVCNQTPPVGDRPSLMSFSEVTTLFHEFGHGLQHMLTRVDQSLAAGIRNVEWDAVELPSQFMENWCYQAETLRRISAHIETGETLPAPLFEKVRAARTFRAGSDMLRQLYFAMTDMALHHEYQPGGPDDAFVVQKRIAAGTTVLQPLPEDRFLCGFSHIFSGGYAAGYYSYKWAEVLSADAFAAFEEAGLEDAEALAAIGRRFRDTVLALGGSRAPMEVFKAFRGREPSPDALLRHSGLASA